MDLGLKERVAIVTGASKGIGRSIALSLAREGVGILACARERGALGALRSEIESLGGTAVSVSADATDPTSVEAVIETATERLGGVDILVNNVGGAVTFGGMMDLAPEDWLRTFELNVMTAVNFVRASLPALRKSPYPRIINISSISGVRPGSQNPHYACSKAALINLNQYWATELAPDRILVNAVCPGPVHSDSWNRNIERVASVRRLSISEATLEVEAEEAEKIPLGRVGDPEDVASLVAFLASDRAAWVTGSCFHVNGGKLGCAR